jgi:hypothetical protein
LIHLFVGGSDLQRIKRKVDILRSVASIIGRGRPDEMLHRVKTQNISRASHENAVKIEVVGRTNLRAVKSNRAGPIGVLAKI